MRGYVRYFFGCRECAHHFEQMAKESMGSVRSLDEAVRWLWLSHNRVNKRLAGESQIRKEDLTHPIYLSL